jgi:sulfonate transport system permease protein
MLLAIVLLAGLGELTDGALSAVETRIMRRRG